MSPPISCDWRVIALSSEVPVGSPVRIAYGSNDFAIFRDANGRCRALADRCAHRRAPLSLGRITKEFLIECPYHGWRYDGASGGCVAIPNLRRHEKIPKTYRVPSFETSERDGFLQIRLGEDKSTSPPPDLALPDAEQRWQGLQVLAYPEELFMDTLVDCPSAILTIPGVQVLDDHPFGDPVIDGAEILIDYAAVPVSELAQRAEQPAEDFAYTLRVHASRTHARLTLMSNITAETCAIAVLVGVPMGQRLTRVLWRGVCPGLSSPSTIGCRSQIDPAPIQISSQAVSRAWAGTLMPVVTG